MPADAPHRRTAERTTSPDVAAPLDLLLHDATRSPLRRFLPGMSGVRFAAGLARRPRRVVGRAAHLSSELAKAGLGRSALEPHEKDRRFADEAWAKNPFLRRTLQGYLAFGETLRGLVPDAELGWGDEQRMGFIVDNLVEASAPSNNPLLNPVVLKRVVDTGGGSLVNGGRRFVRDFATRAAGALDGRAGRLRGGPRHRGDARGGGAPHRRLRADPVHAADAEGPLGAAADRAADHQQVLRHRPGRAAQPGRAPGRPGAAGLLHLVAQPRRPARRLGPGHLRRGDPRGDGRGPQDRPAGAGGAARHLLRRDARLDGDGPPRGHRRPRPGVRVQPRGHGARPAAGRTPERAALPQGGRGVHQGVAGEGLPRRPGAGRGVRLAAAQRPDLELLGQQLPARPTAQGLRHPLLERRPGPDDGGDAPRLHGARAQQRPHPCGRQPDARAATSTSARSTPTPTSWPGSPTTCARGSPATRPPSCSVASPGSCSRPAATSPPWSTRRATPRRASRPASTEHADTADWLAAARKVKGSWWEDYVDWLAERTGPERNKPTRLGSAAFEPICDAPGTYVHDR